MINGSQVHADSKYYNDVVTIPINDFAETLGQSTKTVHVTLPSSPDVCPDTATKWLDVSHSLVLTVNVKVGKKKEKVSIESDIQFLVPRR
ncbi:hypothetical protein BGZ76_008040, partial [Entomortierella beljakovae]